jgi:TetR/AcrR family transcriptional regulator
MTAQRTERERTGGMAKAAHDRNRTRETILTQATAEFASKGYDGARVDSIAERCGLSKNMLYHYFGSKDGLFVAVLERTYEILRARQADLSLRALGPIEAMQKLVEHTFWAFVENPAVIAILNSENLHQGRHIAQSDKIQELYNPLVAMIREVLDRGVKQGVFRAGIDPIILYISLASLGYHYISNQYTLQAALGIDLTSREKQIAWLEHIKDMILAFCRKDEGPAGRSSRRKSPAGRAKAVALPGND